MAIQLEKGQRINLEKDNGAKLTNFCVGCNWGAIVVERTGFFGFGARKEELDVDVDLSCVMVDRQGQLVDTLYSPLYKPAFFSLKDSLSARIGRLTSRCIIPRMIRKGIKEAMTDWTMRL